MANEIDVQFAPNLGEVLPSIAQIQTWANAVLNGRSDNATMSIRIADEDEITELNHTYRDKNTPTNVLSFPMEIPEEVGVNLLGDVVICAPVVAKEAAAQSKTLESHWAHMVIHGTLHLLNYDHINDDDAQVMEAIEMEIMKSLGYDNPYQPVETS